MATVDNDNSQSGAAACPRCGAAVDPAASRCWLCDAALGDLQAAPTSATAQPRHASFSFSFSALMLVVTLVTICCGLIAAAPGLGIPFSVLLVPVFVRTMLVIRRRSQQGRPPSRGEKAQLLATSFGVAATVLVVLCTASAGAFAGVCFGLAAIIDARLEDLGFLFITATVVAAPLSVVALWWCVRWIRARWRRDTQLPED
ncbi:MAG: hypothetical protein CMJ58_02825 [Planctomycetaceae bacterium]|nr:hypothetical protein [Planctomycetaceae bacterium]